ncbi:hypothetical protein [Thioclava sp. JE_KL1]|uniref:hypothetical protein n=1 Tax=Thioclava sp. JE_KL1 TaxID=2651187 RepID=UPI00128BC2E8|nr:hypothetical protein [Thioclava sp. JE_KL1]MPQ95672.1 hypothetical protein [Thioclava sp. JE_KL1]
MDLQVVKLNLGWDAAAAYALFAQRLEHLLFRCIGATGVEIEGQRLELDLGDPRVDLRGGCDRAFQHAFSLVHIAHLGTRNQANLLLVSAFSNLARRFSALVCIHLKSLNTSLG